MILIMKYEMKKLMVDSLRVILVITVTSGAAFADLVVTMGERREKAN